MFLGRQSCFVRRPHTDSRKRKATHSSCSVKLERTFPLQREQSSYVLANTQSHCDSTVVLREVALKENSWRKCWQPQAAPPLTVRVFGQKPWNSVFLSHFFWIIQFGCKLATDPFWYNWIHIDWNYFSNLKVGIVTIPIICACIRPLQRII